MEPGVCPERERFTPDPGESQRHDTLQSDMSFLYHMISDRLQFRQSLCELARHVEAAGVDYFQLREKDLSPAELLTVAHHLRGLLIHTRFVVNGCLDVALAANADGVHLQRENIPIDAVRRRYPELMIGYSAHSREELIAAQEAGATYVFLSPVFPLRSKASSLPPLGVAKLSSWIEGIRIPVFGLGGVTPDNAQDLRSAGCAGLAGISFFVEHGKFSFRRIGF